MRNEREGSKNRGKCVDLVEISTDTDLDNWNSQPKDCVVEISEICFVAITYGSSVAILALAIVQWIIPIAYIDIVRAKVWQHNYLEVWVAFIALLLLLTYVFFFSSLNQLSKSKQFFCTFAIVEIVSLPIIVPAAIATSFEILIAIFATLILAIIASIISLVEAKMKRISIIKYDAKTLIAQTAKLYITVTIVLPTILVYGYIYLQIGITAAIGLLLIFYLIMYAVRIGEIASDEIEQKKQLLWIIVSFILFFTLFLNIIVFIIELKYLH